MKKTKSTATEEIVLLERLTGGDPKKALRNRRVRRAIQTIRYAWSEEPMRFKADLDELMLNTVRWNWPLRIYSPEERQAKEEKFKAELERNRNFRLSPEIAEIMSWWKKVIKTLSLFVIPRRRGGVEASSLTQVVSVEESRSPSVIGKFERCRFCAHRKWIAIYGCDGNLLHHDYRCEIIGFQNSRKYSIGDDYVCDNFKISTPTERAISI